MSEVGASRNLQTSSAGIAGALCQWRYEWHHPKSDLVSPVVLRRILLHFLGFFMGGQPFVGEGGWARRQGRGGCRDTGGIVRTETKSPDGWDMWITCQALKGPWSVDVLQGADGHDGDGMGKRGFSVDEFEALSQPVQARSQENDSGDLYPVRQGWTVRRDESYQI